MKILISGVSLYNNLGGPSIFHGLVRIVRHCFPKCTIVYHYYEKQTLRPAKANIERAYPDVFFINSRPRAKSVPSITSLGGRFSTKFITMPSVPL